MAIGATRSSTHSGGSRAAYSLMAGVLLLMMLGGTIPAPLYGLYRQQIGFGELTITIVFAAYAGGTLLALLFLGGISDHIGRKTVLAGTVVVAAASTVVFLVASEVPLLIVARVLSGIAVGLATGTATAAIAELHPRGDQNAAAVVASGANLTGLGLGPLLAGALAQYVPGPTTTVFWVYLGLLLLAACALLAVPETASERDGVVALTPNVGVPVDLRSVMAGAALGIFAAFTLLGLFSSLTPTFLTDGFGVRNLAVVGAVSFLIFAAGAIGQAVSARLPSRRSAAMGLVLLLLGLAALDSALVMKVLWLFLLATVASGVAIGFIFRGGLAELNRLVSADRRAAVVSAFFLAAYLGMSVPVVVIGVGSEVTSTVTATLLVSALLAVVIVVALGVVLWTFGARTRPVRPCVPSDGRVFPADDSGTEPERPGR